jgi:hypothetical protein
MQYLGKFHSGLLLIERLALTILETKMGLLAQPDRSSGTGVAIKLVLGE